MQPRFRLESTNKIVFILSQDRKLLGSLNKIIW